MKGDINSWILWVPAFHIFLRSLIIGTVLKPRLRQVLTRLETKGDKFNLEE
jgi:hypothetical protein